MFNWINSGNFKDNGKDVQAYEIPEDIHYKPLECSFDLPKGCFAAIDELGMITFMACDAFYRDYHRC